MFAGLTSLTGGGGLDVSSSATAKAGPISVGGLTFAPKQSQDQLITVAIVAGLALALVIAFKKKG